MIMVHNKSKNSNFLFKIKKKFIFTFTNKMEGFKKHYTLNSNFKRIPEKNFWIELKELTNQYKALDLGQVYLKNEYFVFYFNR